MSLWSSGNFGVVLRQRHGRAAERFARLLIIGYSAIISANQSILPDSSCGAGDRTHSGSGRRSVAVTQLF